MHSGKITNPSTGEGRVFRFLRDHLSQWFTLADLNDGAGVEVATTYLSGVRRQLPIHYPEYRLEKAHRICLDGRKRYHHRMVRTYPEQMEFQIPLDAGVVEG